MTHYMELLASNQPWNLLIFMAIPVILAETVAISELFLLFKRGHYPRLQRVNTIAGTVLGFYFLGVFLYLMKNAAIPLIINGFKRPEATRRAAAMLARVGLGERLGSLPAQLSGGQQQRVAIARALVHNPRLIVCDEPTSALDHDTGHKVMELLKTVALDERKALIIVTHDARIFEFADSIAHMDDGHIITLEDRHA